MYAVEPVHHRHSVNRSPTDYGSFRRDSCEDSREVAPAEIYLSVTVADSSPRNGSGTSAKSFM